MRQRRIVYFETHKQQAGGAETYCNLCPRFMNVGLILDVTPQIDEKGNIILSVHPDYVNQR